MATPWAEISNFIHGEQSQSGLVFVPGGKKQLAGLHFHLFRQHIVYEITFNFCCFDGCLDDQFRDLPEQWQGPSATIIVCHAGRLDAG